MLRHLVELLILPPTLPLLMALGGVALRRKRPKLGRALLAGGLLCIWLATTPCVGGALLCGLQSHPPIDSSRRPPAAEAIVVLAAGADRAGGEFGGPTVGPMTMARLRYAAALHRRTGLPLLCSGGRPARDAPSLASMMKHTAETELGVTVTWTESKSANTLENLAFSAELLRARDVQRVLLVTSAWHMPRSLASARRAGLQPIAAPTGFRGPPVASWRSFVPHWTGLRDTCLAMHEWGGRIAYALTP